MGGLKVVVKRNAEYLFKPISVQALWAAHQALHVAHKIACDNNYFANGLSHTWVTYYSANLQSTRVQVNEWSRTDETDENRGEILTQFPEETDDRQRQKVEIRTKLREVMLSEDLEVVTVTQLRRRLAEVMDIDLTPYKNFIGESVVFIFGQLESPSQIFDHVYLGSKWNACNLEELQNKGIGYIINISKEIDNFYPDIFNYYNVRLWDVEQSDLMSYWEETHRYINLARDNNSRVLVHCKMGMSRSATTVMAYAMKEYGWSFQEAYAHVKKLRSCIQPNKGFMNQLHTYEGILSAKSNREKFNLVSEPAVVGAAASPTQPARQAQPPRLERDSDESEESDQPINIEQDILLYKQQPMKEFLSIVGSADNSADSKAPSNPSIAPDPMDEAPSESCAHGGNVNDPRSRDMLSLRDDLIVQKDLTEAPWRQSLRKSRRQSRPEEAEEAPETTSPDDGAEPSCDEPAGANSVGNLNFRPDHSWIKPRADSVQVEFPEPITLVGDIPGEEVSTDAPIDSSDFMEDSNSSADDSEADVVMRDDLNSSLPPSGTVKRTSDLLESLCETPQVQMAPADAPAAVGQASRPSCQAPDVYRLEDISLEPGIVKKTKQTIEARQRTSGEFSGTRSPTPMRLSVGEHNAPRYFSGNLSPGSAATFTVTAPRQRSLSFTQVLSDGCSLLDESSSDLPAPPPSAPVCSASPQEDLVPSQVRRKTLLLIRQVGTAMAHSSGRSEGACVQNVVRAIESSVDREPIQPVRHLLAVFRGASEVVSSG